MILSRLLWRTLVALVGWVFAILSSLVVAVLAIGTLRAGERLVGGDEAGLLALWAAGMRGSLLLPILVHAIWPAWLAAVVLAEVVAARSLAVHLVGAVLVALVAALGTAPIFGLGLLRAVVATALVAGFVHWLVAGRGAGGGASRPADGDPARPAGGGPASAGRSHAPDA